MTQLIKKHKGKMFAAGILLGLLSLGLTAFSGDRGQEETPREILLVAKNLAFRLPDQSNQSNPALVLKRGQPVTLIIRNEEPGTVLHCFTIGGLNVKTSSNLATGQSEKLTFTPEQTGTFAYACLMHPTKIGKVVVL